MEKREVGFFPNWTMFLFLLMPLTRSFSLRLFGSWMVETLLLIACVAALTVHVLYKYRTVPIPFHPLDVAWVLMCAFLLARNQAFMDGYYVDAAFCLLSMLYGMILRCEGRGFSVMRRMVVAFALLYAAVTWLSFFAPSFYLSRVVPILPESAQSGVYVAFTQYGEYTGFTDHYSRNAYYLVLGVIVLSSDMIAGEPRYRIPKAAMIAFLGSTLLLVGKRGHSVFLAFAFFVTYVVHKRPTLSTFIKAGSIAIIGAIFIALATAFVPGADRLVERLFWNDTADYTTGRGELYARAFAMFRAHPIFGNGWGAFSQSTGWVVSGVHNDYLQLLAEVGVIGTCAVLAANYGTYAMTWRLIRELPGDGETGSLIVLSFFFQTFFLTYALTGIPHYDFEVFMVYYLLCAAAFAARLRRPSP